MVQIWLMETLSPNEWLINCNTVLMKLWDLWSLESLQFFVRPVRQKFNVWISHLLTVGCLYYRVPNYLLCLWNLGFSHECRGHIFQEKLDTSITLGWKSWLVLVSHSNLFPLAHDHFSFSMWFISSQRTLKGTLLLPII